MRLFGTEGTAAGLSPLQDMCGITTQHTIRGGVRPRMLSTAPHKKVANILRRRLANGKPVKWTPNCRTQYLGITGLAFFEEGSDALGKVWTGPHPVAEFLLQRLT